MHLLLFILIGLFIGWRSWVFMPMEGFGMSRCMTAGAVGAAAGGYLFRLLVNSASPDLAGSLLAAIVGSLIVLLLARLIIKLFRHYAQTRPKR